MALNVVYVLTNPAMPGLVKIGYTTQEDANTRIGQLYSTGVPVPFKLEYACKVPNPEEVERALHEAFDPQRINPKREFFQIQPEQAIVLLRLLHVPDATSEIEQQPTAPEVDQVSMAAGEILRRSHRPKLNFEDVGIPVASELRFTNDPTIVVIVAPGNKVYLDGESMSFTRATRLALKLPIVAHSRRPSPYWTFNGRSVDQYYEDFHGNGEDA